MKTTFAVIVFAITFSTGFIFVSPRAQAQGGVPLWTNFYHGLPNTYGVANAAAVDSSGNVFVTGSLGFGNGSNYNYVTIKYSNAGAPFGRIVTPVQEMAVCNAP